MNYAGFRNSWYASKISDSLSGCEQATDDSVLLARAILTAGAMISQSIDDAFGETDGQYGPTARALADAANHLDALRLLSTVAGHIRMIADAIETLKRGPRPGPGQKHDPTYDGPQGDI